MPVAHGEIGLVFREITGYKNSRFVDHDDVHASDVARSFFDDGDCFGQRLLGIAPVKAADVVKNFFCPDPAFGPDFDPP